MYTQQYVNGDGTEKQTQSARTRFSHAAPPAFYQDHVQQPQQYPQPSQQYTYPNPHQPYPHLQQHQPGMQGTQFSQQQPPVQQQWLQQSNGVVGPLYPGDPTNPGAIYNPFAQMSVSGSTFAPSNAYQQIHSVGTMNTSSQSASGEPQIPIIPELEGTPAQLALLVDAILNHTGTAAHIEKLKLAFTKSWYVNCSLSASRKPMPTNNALSPTGCSSHSTSAQKATFRDRPSMAPTYTYARSMAFLRSVRSVFLVADLALEAHLLVVPHQTPHLTARPSARPGLAFAHAVSVSEVPHATTTAASSRPRPRWSSSSTSPTPTR